MGKILRKIEKGLEKLTERHFSTEAEMEKFVMNNLELLLGDEIEPRDPRKWLTIKNQLALYSKSTSSTYSVDLVLVDQDAILTLVEFKKVSNSELLREVVGQVLDYSTNVVMHWTADYLRERYENEVKKISEDSNPQSIFCTNFCLADNRNVDAKYSEFWSKVETNIQEHRLRLLIVAERLPLNLSQTISFLNEEFENLEVLGVELQPYASEPLSEIELFAPNLVGIARNKQLISGFRHTRETFMDDFQKQAQDSSLVLELAKVFDWIDERQNDYRYKFDLNQKKRFYIYHTSRVKRHEFCSIDMQGKLTFYPIMGFSDEHQRKLFLDFIRQVFNVFPGDKGNIEALKINADKLIEVFEYVKVITNEP